MNSYVFSSWKWFLFFTVLLTDFVHGSANEVIIPESHPVERYERLWQRNPFTLASIEEFNAAADDLALVGIVKVGNKDYATILNKKTQERMLLSTDKPSNGLRLISIQSASQLKDVSATVERDGQPVTVRFENTALTANPVPPGAQQGIQNRPPNQAMPPQTGQPGTPALNNGQPAGAQGQPPRVLPRRRIIPARPNAAPQK